MFNILGFYSLGFVQFLVSQIASLFDESRNCFLKKRRFYKSTIRRHYLLLPAHQDCIAKIDFHISNKCRLSFKFLGKDYLNSEAIHSITHRQG
jgi:hypothetical protein